MNPARPTSARTRSSAPPPRPRPRHSPPFARRGAHARHNARRRRRWTRPRSASLASRRTRSRGSSRTAPPLVRVEPSRRRGGGRRGMHATPAKYFGLTPYLYRAYRDGSVRTLFASLSDTLSVGASAGETPRRFSRLSTSAGAVPSDADGSCRGVLRGVSCWDSGFAALVGGSRTTSNARPSPRGRAVSSRRLGRRQRVGLSRQIGSGLFGLAGV